ncbi:MAG: flagellar basal body P-ring formation protein FlgA [Planctomycetes bacterium]|nr:flagellar basal body P-ring formation protein FlgA [Planctomycetota bacterium]
MIQILLLCTALLGAPADTQTNRPRVAVVLGSEAKITGTEVKLADIAKLEGTDAAAVAHVGAVGLGWSPAPGHSRVIDGARIIEATTANAAGVEIVLQGSRACRVFVHEERIAPDVLAAAARRELERGLAGRDCEIELHELPRELVVPKGREASQVKATIERLPDSSGSLTVPVRVTVDGQPFRTVQTTWNVRLYQTTAVLARAVRAGEPLDASLLAQRRVELRDYGMGAPLAPQMLYGGVAARDLAMGAAVYSVDVHRPVVIRSGDLITLQVNKGSIRAQTRAIARSAAAVGETITVTAETGRDVSALVVAPGIVELVLGKQR